MDKDEFKIYWKNHWDEYKDEIIQMYRENYDRIMNNPTLLEQWVPMYYPHPNDLDEIKCQYKSHLYSYLNHMNIIDNMIASYKEKENKEK